MIRKIIHIDEEKCNGCGVCAKACHEGAIDMVNGKASVVSARAGVAIVGSSDATIASVSKMLVSLFFIPEPSSCIERPLCWGSPTHGGGAPP